MKSGAEADKFDIGCIGPGFLLRLVEASIVAMSELRTDLVSKEAKTGAYADKDETDERDITMILGLSTGNSLSAHKIVSKILLEIYLKDKHILSTSLIL